MITQSNDVLKGGAGDGLEVNGAGTAFLEPEPLARADHLLHRRVRSQLPNPVIIAAINGSASSAKLSADCDPA